MDWSSKTRKGLEKRMRRSQGRRPSRSEVVRKGEDDRKAGARSGGVGGFLAGGPLPFGGRYCEIGAQTDPRSPDSKGVLIPASRARLFEPANVTLIFFGVKVLARGVKLADAGLDVCSSCELQLC
jgi:hypothetical protein